MVLTALALRLAVVAFVYPEHLNPDRNYWRFAGETGRIAQSLVEGRGYGNPLFGITGPTAWMPPVYPLLVAGAFKLFGVYTKASALMLLSLNCLFSALTCLPVFFLARIGFGERAGVWAGWAWAFFPYAVYFSADFLWPTTLCTLLLTVLLVFALRLETARGLRPDFCFGLLAGLAALTDPIVISVLPFVAAWVYVRRRRQGLPWRGAATAMALGFVLMVTPWFVRNYRTFHAFIPFRDIFGLELHIGNHGDSSHFAPGRDHPSTNEAEMRAYTEMGEQAYMASKLRQAAGYIASHPGWFVGVTLRRILYMWTSFWSLDPQYLAQEPFDLPNFFLTTVLDLVALAGLYRAFRAGSSLAIPLALVLLFFPMVYYVTHWEDYYRRPIDPVFVVLASYEVWSRIRRGREGFPRGSEHSAGATG
ncbi:MAG TPA: glycosyltransferase family 39 protein [Candidatus Acidoferrales bacterium]|nr:glycosyltransferase family 39 protein [Candidatus Acidoferrales bacterium]